MTRSSLGSDLARLGDDLRACTTIDLARERGGDDPAVAAPPRAGVLRRPRVLAGGTLGLAGVGTALTLALTAGGAAAPAAFAITTGQDGTLTVDLSQPGQGLLGLNAHLAARGYDEHVEFTMARGPASTPGVVPCVTSPAGATVSGPQINVTVGPGDSNTETIPSRNTGAGTWHVASCQRMAGQMLDPYAVGHGPDKVQVYGVTKGQAAKIGAETRITRRGQTMTR